MVESASSRKDGKVVAIVAAAGAGHRLGADRPKAFVRVGDYTLLQHTLRRIDASTAVDEIIIMASFEMCATAQEQARELSLSTPMRVFPGAYSAPTPSMRVSNTSCVTMPMRPSVSSSFTMPPAASPPPNCSQR